MPVILYYAKRFLCNANEVSYSIRKELFYELFIFGDLEELLIIPCCHYTISPKYPDLIIRFLFS